MKMDINLVKILKTTYIGYLSMTFGERVSLTRKKLKMSQETLAKEIKTSAPVIGRYERNEIKPSVEVAAKIANTLGVTIDYLIGNSDNVAFDRRTLKRLEEIETLSEEDKEKIYYFIDMAVRDAKAKQAYSS
jgi:transcriptional regulator with XRE-family HTH domain